MFPAIDAAAALSGGRYMTASEARAVFGDTIPFQYWTGSDYVSGDFTYDSSTQMLGCDAVSKTDYIEAKPLALKYVATVSNVNTNKNYITVDVRPSYSLFDTSQLHTIIALSRGAYQVPASNTSPSWDWVWGGSSVHLENDVLNANGYKAQCYFQDWKYSTYVPADFNSQALTSGYSVRAAFTGNGSDGSKFYLYIGVPYVDTDATGSNGTFTTDSGGGSGGDINVTVDVDMEETNGLLSGIKQSIDNLVDAIINGLKSLFIPSDDFMDDFKTDMEELLQDHLGGLYEAEQLIVDSFDELPEVVAKSEIYIPAVNLSLGGETLTLGDWHIPLKVSGLPAILYDGIAFIIDFLCIAAFLRMCRNKLEIFLNPDSEVIQQ